MKKITRHLCAFLLLLTSLASANAAHAATTFYNVTATSQQGYTTQIWLTAFNGFAYCNQRGFDTMIDFTGACGLDEDVYLDHDFYSNTWITRNSTSKNGCYPLFSSITCS